MINLGFSWVDTTLFAPWTTGWTSEAAEGLVSCPPLTPLQASQPIWNKTTMKKQYMVFITMMNVCTIKKGKKTNIGFKVNLLSFDIIGGHIYSLKPGKARFIQLCIYTLQVWVASVTSLEKTENKTKKRNVETMRPSFYGSNIKDNCDLLFLTPVDYTFIVQLVFVLFVLG